MRTESLVRTPTPDVIVPECLLECVQNASVMACVSACEELVCGPTQTGDGYSEPNGPLVSISGTAPVSWDVAYGARFAFSERPSRTRLRGGNPARKRSALDSTRPCGRLKWRRVLFEFGKQGSPCERVCEASRAVRRVFRLRNARSEPPGRHARAGLHGKPCRFRGRVTLPGISQRELRVSCTRWLAWGIPRKRALFVMRRATTRLHVSADRRDERASCRPPPWRCKKKKKASLQVHNPVFGHRSNS